uniref:Uncharacterized protein n=1 Tax=Clastoptera arizonana TaxID=38151 RepID=A0A1B6D7F3_9HEMI
MQTHSEWSHIVNFYVILVQSTFIYSLSYKNASFNDNLFWCDRKLYAHLKNPTAEVKEVIIEDLVTYYFLLCDFMKSNDSIQPTFNKLGSNGGPLILKIDLESSILKMKYNWDEDSMDKVFMLLEDIRKLYDKIIV